LQASAIASAPTSLFASEIGAVPELLATLREENHYFLKGADFRVHLRNNVEPGIDYYTRGNMALITPMAEGRVIRVIPHPKWTRFDKQFIVYIDHGAAKTGIYSHLKSVRVRRGHWVGRFTIIGSGGAITRLPNGKWAKPHLHVSLTYPSHMKPLRLKEETHRTEGKFRPAFEIIDPDKYGIGGNSLGFWTGLDRHENFQKSLLTIKRTADRLFDLMPSGDYLKTAALGHMRQYPLVDILKYKVRALWFAKLQKRPFAQTHESRIEKTAKLFAQLNPRLTLPFINPVLFRQSPKIYELGSTMWDSAALREQNRGKIEAILKAGKRAS